MADSVAKLAFLDLEGDLFPAVWRVAQEGHQVRYWIKDRDENVQKIGKGMVTKVDDLDELARWRPDVAVGYQVPQALTTLRRAGISAWGATAESVELESDRMFAAKLAKRLGVGVVPTTERFASLASARRFVEGHADQCWVVKADGGPKAETSTTHVTNGLDDVMNVLDYEVGRGNTSFVLQERINGVEVSTEGWFDYRRGWLKPINSTLERKRMLTGDVGPMCGAAGSIVWTWPDAEPQIWKETLKQLTPWLEEVKYVGPIDVNCIVDEKEHKPHFLEFTPRLGWSAFNAIMAGLVEGVGDAFVGLGQGTVGAFAFRHPFMASVAVSIPEAADVPLIAPYHAVRHIQPANCWLDRGVLRTTGAGSESGFIKVFEATDAGSSIDECMASIYYRQIPRILSPDTIAYRKDIGEQARYDLSRLESWGYQVHPAEDIIGKSRRELVPA